MHGPTGCSGVQARPKSGQRLGANAPRSTSPQRQPAGSRVAVSGHSMMVAESHACCDLFGRVHHWELKVR